MQNASSKSGKPYNPDGVKFIDPTIPSALQFCGWMKRPWGGQCHVHNDIASYSYHRFNDNEPCIKFRKEWITIEVFKQKKLKELHDKEVKYKQNLNERVNNL